jgi:hypothetical protein
MTNPEPAPDKPGKGATRVVDGQLEEFDGSAWVPYVYLPSAGSGGDGKPLVIYKIVTDFEVDG